VDPAKNGVGANYRTSNLRTDMDTSILRALRNIAKFGDTDIFPLPFERHIFHDDLAEAARIVRDLHIDFESTLAAHRPENIELLAPVGYTGFRWATQIEPFWNAYYLAMVLELADEIEQQRRPIAEKSVFSYRYQWSDLDCKIFAPISWLDYRARCRVLAETSAYVVLTDISDFYPRIYHHRLENALARLPSSGALRSRIMRFLQVCSSTDSYGLPVGGPASRLLAELSLVDVDSYLTAKSIPFCRYADDFTIFATSREQAYRQLAFLADKLFNEGLSLQKKKTRILKTDEYLEMIGGLDPQAIQNEAQTDEDRLLSISVRFDPYSPTAVEDYRNLKAALAHIDIVAILGREVAKAAIDTAVTRQAIAAIAALEDDQQEGAIRTLLDPENILVLAPVFISIMRIVRELYDGFAERCKAYVDAFLVQLFDDSSYLLSLELNQAFYVQAISKGLSGRKEQILIEMYGLSSSPLVRREIVLGMIEMNALYWLRDIVKNSFGSATEWEKRALLIASYWLGDEGSHWRNHLKKGMSPPQLLVRDWFAARWSSNRSVPH
jgi:hypothetical protein